jgi:cation:H+ antiporter
MAALLAPLPLERKVVNRQGWIQIGAGVLLVAFCIPWKSPSVAFSEGGNLPQWSGFIMVGLLVLYILGTIHGAKQSRDFGLEVEEIDAGSGKKIFFTLGLGIVLVIGSSHVLIPTAEETALRLGVPEAIIAATLVAFGTSLPEFVTCLSAVRRNHGELAIGNVIGADILNVLFVAGLSAAVTSGGLDADPRFFRLLFPGMLALLVVFRVGVMVNKTHLGRGFGAVLLGIYLAITALSYLL